MFLYPKVVFASTFQVFVIGFLLSYFQIDLPVPKFHLATWVKTKFPYFDNNEKQFESIKSSPDESNGKFQKLKSSIKSADDTTKKIFTPKQLAKHDGSKGSLGLYLALLGRVYDVEKGRKHYGPNGGYHFFAGKDATRAFVSGDFSEQGLVDDVSGLPPQDLIGIEEWVQFYEKEYKFVGYIQGTYYDAQGRPTHKLKEARKLFDSAHKWQSSQKAELERFPTCNSEWSQGKGGRVWCTNKSGGINRDWVGVPRKLFKPGGGQSRCACVKDSGPSQDESEQQQGDNGDLDHPNLREYDGCDPKAVSCNIPSS